MNTSIPKTPIQIFLNTVSWGFVLWFLGYILGIIFFMFVPKNQIGWYILPIGVAMTVWVLLKKIHRKSFSCYIGLSIFWTLIAVVCDYIFIVKLLRSSDYYKMDVYTYYLVTFLLPLIVGKYKHTKISTNNPS